MRRLALLLSIIALPLAFTATAAANTVTRTVGSIDETELFGGATFFCGFDVYLHTEGSIQETDYFDNSGTLVRQIFTNVGGPIRLTSECWKNSVPPAACRLPVPKPWKSVSRTAPPAAAGSTL